LDIKPSNFVFDEEFNPIFIDYSLSMIVKNSSDIIKGSRGTKEYECPEMWGKSGFIGEKADIFSLGAFLFNLVTGINGFMSSKRNDPYYKYIISKNFNKYWNSLKNYIKFPLSQEFKDLYIQMISYNSSERPTLTEILESRWMEEINKLDEEDLEKLEKELKDLFNNLYNELQNENEEIKIAKKFEFMGYNTRSFDDNKEYYGDS